MNIYKRHHLLKSAMRFLIVFFIALCALFYQIGWQRGYSYSQATSIELLAPCID